jgi:hypothetical protein
MALLLHQTVGSVILFDVKDRTARLRLDRIQDGEVTFGLLIGGKQYSRPRRSAESVLNFQMRGELISVHVDELHAKKVVLRIAASPAVRIMRREALRKLPASNSEAALPDVPSEARPVG